MTNLFKKKISFHHQKSVKEINFILYFMTVRIQEREYK